MTIGLRVGTVHKTGFRGTCDPTSGHRFFVFPDAVAACHHARLRASSTRYGSAAPGDPRLCTAGLRWAPALQRIRAAKDDALRCVRGTRPMQPPTPVPAAASVFRTKHYRPSGPSQQSRLHRSRIYERAAAVRVTSGDPLNAGKAVLQRVVAGKKPRGRRSSLPASCAAPRRSDMVDPITDALALLRDASTLRQ